MFIRFCFRLTGSQISTNCLALAVCSLGCAGSKQSPVPGVLPPVWLEPHQGIMMVCCLVFLGASIVQTRSLIILFVPFSSSLDVTLFIYLSAGFRSESVCVFATRHLTNSLSSLSATPFIMLFAMKVGVFGRMVVCSALRLYRIGPISFVGM